MFRELGENNFKRLVIDSINALCRKNKLMMKSLKQPYTEDDHYELVLNLVERAKELGITCFLLTEWVGDIGPQSYESIIGDGIIELHVNDALNSRAIVIRKLRGTSHGLKPLPFKFKENEGIVVIHVSRGGI
jgi:KaiC/GvpD/RAD55 family RecA-like ATPase